MTTRELRERAALLIEQRGWRQGDWRGPNGELCLDAALVIAAGKIEPEDLAEEWPALATAADDEIAAELGFGSSGSSCAHWNDDPRRTKAEVLAALRGGRATR